MASSSRKRQTIAKRDRERAVKEKRALKQEKKEARKQAAAEARNGARAELTGIVELPADSLAPSHVAAVLHDGTGAHAPQPERDVQDEPGPHEAGQVDHDERHVAYDDAVREPDRISR
jgi:hypothetical protein